MVNAISKFHKFFKGMARIIKIAKSIDVDGLSRKSARVSQQRLEPKYIPRQRGQISLACHTNTKYKPKVQFSTRVAPKDENHPMFKTKKVVLWYQAKLCLCQRGNVKSWFIVLSQIMFVPRMEYYKLVWWYQAKSYLCRGRNVKNWLCAPIQIMFVSRTEC